jgi:phosphoadenosine phosphosulfate reductase
MSPYLADFDQVKIDTLSREFEDQSPQDIIVWAVETLGPGVVMTSSFQTQSVPLLHMVAQIAPQLPILFLDTGFHFPETLAFRDRLIQEFGLNVRILTPEIGHDGFKRKHGSLYRTNPDLCCYLNKVEPFQRAMAGFHGWISGLRRDQTPNRGDTPIIARQANGQYKISPLATWTRRDVWQYLYDHNLPEHPLLAQGYLSIGCAPCTVPASGDGDVRAGRWNGQEKTECGLHIDLHLKG